MTTIQLNFQPDDMPPVWITTKILVFEDRSLSRHTCIDMVLHGRLIDLLPPQLRGHASP